MEKELKSFMEAQERFQKTTLEGMESAARNFKTFDERIIVLHERIDLQGKQIDALLNILTKLGNQVNILREWKLEKEGM